jgi:3-oxoacyl-[acyl-carrier-protein] synthase III
MTRRRSLPGYRARSAAPSRSSRLRKTESSVAFEDWGNMASATVAASLARAVEGGELRSGDRVVLGGMASGLNVGLVGLEW